MGLYQKIKQKIKDKIREKIPMMTVWMLILLCVCIILFNRIFIFVESGEAGVLYRLFFGGTVTTEVYGEGIQFVWPWDTMTIYNVRVQEIATELDVLTKSGLQVHLYLSIRYRPEYKLVGILHKTVGPDYVDMVVIPEIEAVLREVIGMMEAEEIYTTGREVITKAIEEAIEQVAQRFIVVDDVILTRIELPTSVAETIKYKIQQMHLIEAQQYKVEKEKHEAERKRIEGQGIRDRNNIIASSLKDERIMRWYGIDAVKEFAKSETSTVVITGGEGGLPIIGNLPLKDITGLTPAVSPQNEKEAATEAGVNITSEDMIGLGQNSGETEPEASTATETGTQTSSESGTATTQPSENTQTGTQGTQG